MTSSSDPARLVLTSREPGTLLTVLDSGLRPVAVARGSLDQNFRPGVYRIEGRLGDTSVTQLVTLEPGSRVEHNFAVVFATAAPAEGASTSYETHGDLVTALSADVTGGAGPDDAGAVVTLRNLRGRKPSALSTDSVALLTSSLEPVSEWFSDWVFGDGIGGIAGRAGRFLPGPYVLRTSRKGRGGTDDVTDQTVWLASGWQTLVFVPNSPTGPDARGISVQMARVCGPAWQAAESVSLAVEAALAGLRNGVPSVPKDLMQVLLRSKFNNPMLGILGLHAMLLGPPADRKLFGTVLGNLKDLVGDHPDVVALEALRGTAGQVSWPPMLASSYHRCLRSVDLEGRDVLPAGSAAERVAPFLRMQGPWLQWTATPELITTRHVPSAATEQVERAVGSMAEFYDRTPADIVRELGTTELARRTKLPVGLVDATVRQLGI